MPDYCSRVICPGCGRPMFPQSGAGLCWSCCRAGVELPDAVPDFSGPAKPTTPTDAPPRSPAKVEVLAGRAERGEELWHPRDAPDFDMGSHRRKRRKVS